MGEDINAKAEREEEEYNRGKDKGFPAWRCPFCGGRLSGGSWTPDICTDCGAREVSHGEWMTKEGFEAYKAQES